MDSKILVISDLKDRAEKTLNTAAKLAKTLNRELYFLSVSKPLEIVGNESQLTALRNINQKQSKAIDDIKNLIKPSQEEGLSVDFKHSIGNVKNEILAHIKVLQPEIIVLGKRKKKSLNIIGDKLTDAILKHHEGIVILADEKEDPKNGKYALAILGDELSEKGKYLAKAMAKPNEKPERIKPNSTKRIGLSLRKPAMNKVTLRLLSEKYNLIFLNRNHHQKDLKRVIAKVDCSVAITN